MARVLSSSLRVPKPEVTAAVAFLRTVTPTVRAAPRAVNKEAELKGPGYLRRTVASGQTVAKSGEAHVASIAKWHLQQQQQQRQAAQNSTPTTARGYLCATEASRRRSADASAPAVKRKVQKETPERKDLKTAPSTRVTAQKAAPTKVWCSEWICLVVYIIP